MAQQTFNSIKINVEFEESASRQQLNSGENISTLFGKIKKIFSDLKAVCFSGSYNDLSDTPSTATTSTDGLMSSADKTKLDNADNKYALKSKYGDTTINVGRKADSPVGDYSTAEGYDTTASGAYSHAEGRATRSIGKYAHTEGYSTESSGISSHSEGENTKATGDFSHAEGFTTMAIGESAHAEGFITKSDGYGAHAEGGDYVDTGSGTLAHLPSKNVVIDDATTITLDGSRAYGANSHAEGCQTLAYGAATHSEGWGTFAKNDCAHAEGYKTQALRNSSHAEGRFTIANGDGSHAEGYGTTANGYCSHAEGASSNIASNVIADFSSSANIITAWTDNKFSLAKDNYSHSEGNNTLALGVCSHAEGELTIARGYCSGAHGYYTQALHGYETSFGKYNQSNSDTLFSVGDGTSDSARHNAFEITTDGGKLHDKDIATLDDIPTALPASNVTDIYSATGTNPVNGKAVASAISTKVDKISGKNLSTNDLTDTLKNNYDAAYTHSQSAHAPSSAQANVIETIKVNNTALTPTNKTVNITVPSNTDRYVNKAEFVDDSTTTAASPVKMTLTRAGSDTNTITANIPKVSSSSAGVVPKGSAVSSQSNTTKFLREDGTWAAPSYTTNTDTKVTAVGNHYTPAKSTTKSASGGTLTDITNSTSGTQVVTGVEMDAKGHVTGVTAVALKSTESNPNLLINPDFKINQRGISGPFSETGKYFVDRWRLESGTVTVNSDGTLTLNGTIAQVLENATGTDVIASSDGGSASYDNSSGKFSLTGSGTVISWAKLEYGSTATPFIPPNTTIELLKCQRFYREIVGEYLATIISSGLTSTYITIDNMRIIKDDNGSILSPSVYFKSNLFNSNSGARVVTNTGNAIQGFTFGCNYYDLAKSIYVTASKSAHGLDRNSHIIVIDNNNPVCIDAEL
jgi:hypothetical protein